MLSLCVSNHDPILPCVEVVVVVDARLLFRSRSPSCRMVLRWLLLFAVAVASHSGGRCSQVVAARSGWLLAGSLFRSGGGGRRECWYEFENVGVSVREGFERMMLLLVTNKTNAAH